ISAYIDPRVSPRIRKPRKSDKGERLSGEPAGRHPPAQPGRRNGCRGETVTHKEGRSRPFGPAPPLRHRLRPPEKAVQRLLLILDVTEDLDLTVLLLEQVD